MNVNGLLTKCWLSHLESNQNSGYQKPVCSRYTMGQAELRILYHISFAHRPVRMKLMRYGLLMLICLPTCGFVSGNRARPLRRAPCPSFDPLGRTSRGIPITGLFQRCMDKQVRRLRICSVAPESAYRVGIRLVLA